MPNELHAVVKAKQWRPVPYIMPPPLVTVEVLFSDLSTADAFYVPAPLGGSQGGRWYIHTPDATDTMVPDDTEPHAWRHKLTPQERHIFDLRVVLDALVTEVSGVLAAFGSDLRYIAGNTNIEMIERRVVWARQVLDETPPPLTDDR